MRIGFAHYLRIVDFNLRELEGKRGEGKCHAMILVGVDRLETRLAGLAIPNQRVIVLVINHVTHLLQLLLQCLDAVGLLNLETGKTGELKLYAQGTAGYNDGLCKVWRTAEIVVETRQETTLDFQLDRRKNITVLKF